MTKAEHIALYLVSLAFFTGVYLLYRFIKWIIKKIRHSDDKAEKVKKPKIKKTTYTMDEFEKVWRSGNFSEQPGVYILTIHNSETTSPLKNYEYIISASVHNLYYSVNQQLKGRNAKSIKKAVKQKSRKHVYVTLIPGAKNDSDKLVKRIRKSYPRPEGKKTIKDY